MAGIWDSTLDSLIYGKLSQKQYKEQWEFKEGREITHSWGDSGRTEEHSS